MLISSEVDDTTKYLFYTIPISVEQFKLLTVQSVCVVERLL